MPDADHAADYGFSQARAADGLLFCSGQIGLEDDGGVPTDPQRQYALAFAALGELLARHGCAAADLVDLTSFHVGYPANMDTFMGQMGAFLGDARPCWTAVGVAALGYPDSLVEIKAIARLPEGRR